MLKCNQHRSKIKEALMILLQRQQLANTNNMHVAAHLDL